MMAIAELLRETAIAASFGASSPLDAFFGVWIVPAMIVGVATYLGKLVVVPVATAVLEEHSAAAHERFAPVFLRVVILALGVSTLVTYCSPWIAALVLPGMAADLRAVAVESLRRLPLFLGAGLISGFLVAFLQARRRFLVAALAAALPSLTVAFAAILPDATVARLAWAFSWGAVLQVVVLWGAAAGAGLPWLPRGLRRSELTITMLGLAWAPAVMMGARSLTMIADRACASYLDVGSVACLNYAFRLTVGVRVLVTGTAFTVGIPFLSMLLAQGREEAMSRLVRQSIRAVVLVLAPISAALLVLGDQVVGLLLMRGEFDPAGATTTGAVLAVMAQTLIPDSLFALLAAPFFARRLPRVPMVVALQVLPLHLLLVWPATRLWGVAGIPLAGVLSMIVGAWLLWRRSVALGLCMQRDERRDLRAATLGSGLLFLVAGVANLSGLIPPLDASWFERALALTLLGPVLLLVYVLVLLRYSSHRRLGDLLELIRGRTTR